MYAFAGDGPDDLCEFDYLLCGHRMRLKIRILAFSENLTLIANPSKVGGDWWYGKTVSNGKSGLFPKTYVEVFTPSMFYQFILLRRLLTSFLEKAKAVYTYTAGNADELPFDEGDELSIIDMSEDEWWKTEKDGVVFIVPAAYLEIVEG